MAKTGNAPKGADFLNQIIMNRIPPKHRKVIKKAEKEVSEAKHEAIKKAHEALAAKRAAKKAADNPDQKPETPDLGNTDGSEVNDDGEILTKKEKKLKDDLIWVLEQMGGRNKILAMAKKSDALKITIIKELLKVEVKELEARLRSKVTPANTQNGFFFCLSGLDDRKKIQEKTGIDLKFLGNALTPTEPVPIDIGGEEEEVIEP